MVDVSSNFDEEVDSKTEVDKGNGNGGDNTPSNPADSITLTTSELEEKIKAEREKALEEYKKENEGKQKEPEVKVDDVIKKLDEDLSTWGKKESLSDDELLQVIKERNPNLDEDETLALYETLLNHKDRVNKEKIYIKEKNDKILKQKTDHEENLKIQKTEAETKQQKAVETAMVSFKEESSKIDYFGNKQVDHDKIIQVLFDGTLAKAIEADKKLLLNIAYLYTSGFFNNKNILKDYYRGQVMKDLDGKGLDNSMSSGNEYDLEGGFSFNP